MHVERIRTQDELNNLTLEWPCLTRGNPFRSWQWLCAWWQHFGTAGDLYVLAARNENNALIGLAPWFIEQSATRGRAIRFLGSDNVCTDYLTILSTEEHEKYVVQTIADWLIRANQQIDNYDDRWDLLQLDAIPAADLMIAKLVERLAERDCNVHRRPADNCWRIELPHSWADYLATMSKSHRKQVRRVEKRMLETGRATLHTAQSEKEWQHGMEILVRLHQKRRNSLGELGCFADERFQPFLENAAHELFKIDCAELHWIELDGVAVAAEYHAIGNNTSYAYQAGIDPDAMEQEPGRIINVATIKRAVELGRDGFDFLRGDEPYKAHWRAEPIPLVDLRIAAQHTTAQIRHGFWRAGDTMKNWIKTGIERIGM
jgi:CelD/BcsL family acetyltransferase involved in cellulose biosynthesis